MNVALRRSVHEGRPAMDTHEFDEMNEATIKGWDTVEDQFDKDAEKEVIEFTGHLQELSERFDQLCQERHEMGQSEYGKLTFLKNDVVRMMIEELADTANYCRYQAVKLLLMQQLLEEELADTLLEEGQEEITIGVKAFRGVADVGWQGVKK